MTNQNDEMKFVESDELVELDQNTEQTDEVEVAEVEELVAERDPLLNMQVAAAIMQQNPDRAREIVKNRLSEMEPEQIENLRTAKAEKEACKALEALESQPEEAVAPVVIEEKPAKEKPVKEKKRKSRRGISYESRQAFTGFMFVLPWFVGFLLFFAYPCFQSLQFAFSKVAVFENYKCTWIGIENFKELLTSEAVFLQALIDTLLDLAVNVPVVLIFSLFVAVLLNRKFAGRGLVRGIFFLPVIVTTGVVMTTFRHSDSNAAMSGSMNNGVLFQVADASSFLVELGMNETITTYMTMVADRIFDVVWDSGIQILLFLAALQGISPSLYEASDVEGATAWETFWLITFPNVAPVILVNIVYTIVNTYNDTDNAVLKQINNMMTGIFDFGGAAAASWTFFIVIFAILGLVFLIYKILTKNSN